MKYAFGNQFLYGLARCRIGEERFEDWSREHHFRGIVRFPDLLEVGSHLLPTRSFAEIRVGARGVVQDELDVFLADILIRVDCIEVHDC